MAIPSYQQLMQPLLEYLSDGETRSSRERAEWLAERFGLTNDERAEMIPSGRLTTLASRQHWASTYLRQAGLLTSQGRGFACITPRGHAALRDAERGPSINTKYLQQFAEFQAFMARSSSHPTPSPRPDSASGPEPGLEEEETPEEAIEQAHRRLRAALAADLLEKIKAGSPGFFERLVLKLLVAMGYGGSFEDAARAVGGSGDGGIDGIIKEDQLGLDSIHLQAKRWNDVVGRPVVQAFVGSIEGRRADKGVLITTSSFSKEAREYVQRIGKTIVLIDGAQLTSLMIDYGVGVTTVETYAIKRLDEEFFADA
ncbi:MAG: restriction endonuclease, partial [Thermomicrobiales bacterium]|nr:restriction endonuclease [Thermomicrobiales bacterium]